MTEKNAHPKEGSNFEEALARLEGIVGRLEDGEVGLAESLAAYEEGVKHLRQCHQLLERAERRIELLTGFDAEGNPVRQPFDEEDAASLEKKAASRGRRRTAGDAGKTPRSRGNPPAEEADDMDDSARLF
jgi:exodeoxyribonuclease VII small subunit